MEFRFSKNSPRRFPTFPDIFAIINRGSRSLPPAGKPGRSRFANGALVITIHHDSSQSRRLVSQIQTKTRRTFRRLAGCALTSVDQTEPGIFDVRSGAQGLSLDGTPYAEW